MSTIQVTIQPRVKTSTVLRTGATGIRGEKGDQGNTGSSGLSAYQVAVAGGFVGTEAQWLASLKGETGATGAPSTVPGPKGDQGDDGLSAYEVAVAAGYSGTESQWLASLKGEKGDKGDTGETGAASTVPGPKGDTGATGPANTLSIGTVEPGGSAAATITGTAPNQTLNLVLPEGPQGDTGEVGPQGKPGLGYTVVTSALTLANYDRIAANTSGGAFSVTLPASPNNGDQISIYDYAGTFATENLTILRNGNPIESLAENLVCNVNGAAFDLIYGGATIGWHVQPQAAAPINNVAVNNQDNLFTAGQTITAPANTSALTASYSVTGANTTPLLNLSGTWNTSGIANGIRLNVTDTASATGSLLADLGTGSRTQYALTKSRQFWLYNSSPATQTAANYERGYMRWNANALEIGTESGGTGAARGVTLDCASGATLTIRTGGTNRVVFGSVQASFATNVNIIAGSNLRLAGSVTPASATATGTTGDIQWDANFIYVAVGTNTWKRAALTTW